MLSRPDRFYDELAANYHLIFEDWNASMKRQGEALKTILDRESGGAHSLRILDCACGIGTQALALAELGFEVTASDISAAALKRARIEAKARSVEIRFFVSDMRDLTAITESDFDAVVCLDNALPHFESDQDLQNALTEARRKLRPGGTLLASIRDYDSLLHEKPVVQGPAFYSDSGRRRIVHQLWDWIDERRYVLHLYITRELETGWDAKHYVSNYRALSRQELIRDAEAAGFRNCRWIFPAESGFYQPLLLAVG